MLALQTILHPTDFSDRSDYAFRLACSLARDYNAHLVIVHVLAPPVIGYGEGVIPPEPDLMRAEARHQLASLAAPSELRVERQVIEGDPVTEILQVADEVDADLIVMGTHGRTGMGRFFMGSIAEQVLRRASCPVLTLKMPFTPHSVAAGVGAPVTASVK